MVNQTETLLSHLLAGAVAAINVGCPDPVGRIGGWWKGWWLAGSNGNKAETDLGIFFLNKNVG